MRFSLVCATVLALFAGQAKASLVTLSTAEHPLGGTSALSATIQVAVIPNILFQNITIGGAITGSGVFDYVLDGSNTGTVETISNSLSLAGGAVVMTGPLLFGTASWTALGAELSFDDSVVNRLGSLDATTAAGANFAPSGLSLNSGTIILNITAGLVTTAVTLDLSSSPLGVNFSSLGTVSIPIEADLDGSGSNPAGPEFDIPSLAFNTTLSLPPLTPNLIVSGQIYLGATIPEFGSFGLVSMAVAGLGGVVAFRRRRTA